MSRYQGKSVAPLVGHCGSLGTKGTPGSVLRDEPGESSHLEVRCVDSSTDAEQLSMSAPLCLPRTRALTACRVGAADAA